MSRALDETGLAASRAAAPRLDRRNVLIVVAIGAAGALSLWLEGYAPRIDRGFGIFGIIMFALAAWVAAFAISTGRLLRLAAVAGAGGYATQYVGATLGGIWHYPPPTQSFYFVPAMFRIASLVAYGLTVSVLAPRWHGSLRALPRWANLLAVAVLIGIVTGPPGSQGPLAHGPRVTQNMRARGPEQCACERRQASPAGSSLACPERGPLQEEHSP